MTRRIPMSHSAAMIEGDIAPRTEPIAASSASMVRADVVRGQDKDSVTGEVSAARIDEFKRRIDALEREIEAIRHKLLAIGDVAVPLVS